MRFIKVCIRYSILLIVVTISTLSLEFVSGLIPQNLIHNHLLGSMGQLKEEGLTPGILYTLHPRSLIDNFSENYILTYSYYMNTCIDPSSILTNPGRSIKEPANELFIQTEMMLRENLQPDAHYSRYWMGFRIYVRPLLALMNYMDIRQCIQLGFYILIGFVILVLYRNSGSFLIALSFLISIALLNPTVITACFQYSVCFYMAFIFMLLIPHIVKSNQTIITIPMFFFLIGAITQVFDFYTAPLLTYGYPALMMFASEDKNSKQQDKTRQALQMLISWIIGYVLCWLLKLAITSIFTPINSFEEGFSRFSMWMLEGLSSSEKDVLLPFKAVFYNIINILDLIPIIMAGLILFCYTISLIRRKKRHAEWKKGNEVYLLIALFPILWFFIAAKPSFGHAYFQYRSIGISVFAILLFLIRTAEWDHLFIEK